MSVLTIEETKKRHKELWMWIAEETRRRKKKVRGNEYFLFHQEYEAPIFSCWCCEFCSRISDILYGWCNCDLCPVDKWGDLIEGSVLCGYPCMEKGAIHLSFMEEKDWQKAAEIAEQIANLPFKKAFDITPEQAKMLRDKGFGDIYSVEEV